MGRVSTTEPIMIILIVYPSLAHALALCSPFLPVPRLLFQLTNPFPLIRLFKGGWTKYPLSVKAMAA